MVLNRSLKRMAAGADKRKYPRVQARNVSAHLNVSDRSTPCVIHNISAGGVYIETKDALPVGMPVAVNLARPGWTRVLKLTGRVVWALAERTAQRKGTIPGMRIKFDPLTRETAGRLVELLKQLGAPEGPPPPTSKDSGTITQPVGIKDIQSRLEESPFPLVRAPDLSPPKKGASAPRFSPPTPNTSPPKKGASAPRFSPPTPNTSPPKKGAKAPHRPDDATMPARVGELAAVFGKPSDSAPRLIVQVQGLLMQLGDLQQQLETREREVQALKSQLSAREQQLEKAERERRAAELAVQRLSMQLAARR
jgi:hypothetical protein